MTIESSPTLALVDPASLPTHIAAVVSRVNCAGPDSSADTFLLTSYVVESLIKTIAITICAPIRRTASDVVYRYEYELVRGNGLGTWEQTIAACTTQSHAGYVDSEVQPLLLWLTKRRTKAEDQWARDTATHCASILKLLGLPDVDVPRKLTIRFVFGQLVRIRNKTKAHGAVGEEFFNAANTHYLSATRLLLEHCPAFKWDWFFLAARVGRGDVKAVHLQGTSPKHVLAAESEALRPETEGIHFQTNKGGRLFNCGALLETGWECRSFYLANGSLTETGSAEFIDYSDGSLVQRDMSRFLAPPAPLPRSATEGGAVLDIFSNVFGNLPPPPEGYVERPALQTELRTRLEDTNHPILTLHGRGGIGKTSLALYVAHQLADSDPAQFDQILWLSARDLELKPSGSSEVRRAIPNLDSVCKLLSDFLDIEPTIESLAQLLQDPSAVATNGMLWIFDNFETLDDPQGIHKFLDTHTHIPNKILMTSRERAFKGDFPIEVGGMEFPEAKELLKQEAITLGIDSIVTDAVINDIYEYTDGHAYVMRVLLGEIAKDRRWVPLRSLVPRRGDLLDAVFERSFNKLSPGAHWVFLTISSWRSVLSELALLVVIGMRDFDVEEALDECVRLSLINRRELSDGQTCYFAPELARIFAKKKLDGDPDRLLINEDLQVLRQFGPISVGEIGGLGIDQLVEHFVTQTLEKATRSKDPDANKADSVLVRVAEMWPRAWLAVAQLRKECGHTDEDVSYALRRAVEERPYEKEAWLARANHASEIGDDTTRMASLVSAVETDPGDVELIREAAFQLCKYVDEHKSEIPPARRGVYLASVRSHMEKGAEKLDPTGLSRLAWLFLLEGDELSGWKYANMGLGKDATNVHCLRIVGRLEESGFRPGVS